MILSMLPLGSRDVLRLALQPRCLNVCAISVVGSAGTFTKFGEDLARAREVFRCANIQLHQGGFMPVRDNTLLDLTGWTTDAVSADARRLLAMGPACGRGERPSPFPTVYAYYVRTLGGGYNGIGRPNFANNAPGLVLSDAAGPYTFAHEIGHILGLEHVPTTQTDNIMYFDSPNITVDPPNITPVQCARARASSIPVACTEALQLPPVRTPRIIGRPPFEATPALTGLLSDDPGVVERFAAMGAAILPQLLSRVNDPNLAIRTRVLAVLARINNPMAQQAVQMAAMSDPSPSVRATAAAGLGQMVSPMAGPILARTVLDIDPGVRAAAIRTLGQSRMPGALTAAGMVAAREADPFVRQLAARVAMGAG
ncbi:MAG TPA: HEAT repeat domain-containing protein [Symbiobacteriaceae bacterium]|nr:HEAT repeat domain-containing protein [Symbiobacteriaceae bacterium]